MPVDAVERRDEMHLRRAGIGEADVDVGGEERADEGFGAVHGMSPGVGGKGQGGRAADAIFPRRGRSRRGRAAEYERHNLDT